MQETKATASDVMDPRPRVLKSTDTIGEGVRIFMKYRYRNLPVVDDTGRFIGVFGVHCLLRLVLPKAVLLEDGLTSVPYVRDTLLDLRQRLATVETEPVTHCLKDDIPTVHPDTPLVETLLILYRSRVSIPVIDPVSKELVGMISYFDVGKNVLAQEI